MNMEPAARSCSATSNARNVEQHSAIPRSDSTGRNQRPMRRPCTKPATIWSPSHDSTEATWTATCTPWRDDRRSVGLRGAAQSRTDNECVRGQNALPRDRGIVAAAAASSGLDLWPLQTGMISIRLSRPAKSSLFRVYSRAEWAWAVAAISRSMERARGWRPASTTAAAMCP